MDTFTNNLLERYGDHQEALGYATKTLVRDKREARAFWQWAAAQGDHHPLEITASLAWDYQRHLRLCGKLGNKQLDPQTVRLKLGRLKRLYRWLFHQDLIGGNPFACLKFGARPRQSKRQPLTQSEIARLMAAPDVTRPLGVRNRAILEVFYSTGLRKMELARLACLDVDAAHGWVRVHESKTKTSRVVPIGESALFWVMRYLAEVRSRLLRGPDPGHLLLSCRWKSLVGQGTLKEIVKHSMNRGGIYRSGSCHLLRHSAATHMLQHGADIRVIQQMLGHRSIESTEGYTQLTCGDLKDIQKRCHPWP
jgi:integrase/recombinase XerD